VSHSSGGYHTVFRLHQSLLRGFSLRVVLFSLTLNFDKLLKLKMFVFLKVTVTCEVNDLENSLFEHFVTLVSWY